MKHKSKRRQPLKEQAATARQERADIRHPPVKSNKPLKFFNEGDDILLVGEGDLSFTKALLLPPHSCPLDRLTATVFDSEADLLKKYDTAAENLKFLEEFRPDEKIEEDDFEAIEDQEEQEGKTYEKRVKVLFNVDATNLMKTKYIRKRKFNCCIFNFPHTGSGITDQDRNILKNQELLVGFFKSVPAVLKPRGVVVVTVFEGLPYSLWKLKELAKAAGFESERSGKFQWEQFPEYRHRRTAGMGDTNKKAQERDARTYIFKLKTDKPIEKKRKHESSDSE